MLRELRLRTFKIASSESGNLWWQPAAGEAWFVSYAWGRGDWIREVVTRLTAIPLYPTPLEAVDRAPLLDGWSDHVEGIDACLWALSRDVQAIEVHFTIGKGRVCSWDKTPDQVRELRRFADSCETIRTGVATRFRERWKR
jgi:hypothetical protein